MKSGGLSELYCEMHSIVRGQVQGVCFRATTQHHAQKLGLVGTVKNLADGTVEIYAQGERELLEKLLSALKSDAGFARVDGISSDYFPLKHSFRSFEVIF